jgi:predicted dithiol-disulfide oxidoreductase (DUF899 family)
VIERSAINLPQIVSTTEWQAARDALLAKEKEATRARDALAAERRRLPMVRIDKDYAFDGPDGKTRLLDLFEGRRQLLLYHFMFGPNQDAGCDGCSMFVDQIGHLAHLHARDTSFALVSRAPLAKITAYKKRMGWTIPWYSSFESDFNVDFGVSPGTPRRTSTRTASRSGSASSCTTATTSFAATSRRTAASRRSAACGPSST